MESLRFLDIEAHIESSSININHWINRHLEIFILNYLPLSINSFQSSFQKIYIFYNPDLRYDSFLSNCSAKRNVTIRRQASFTLLFSPHSLMLLFIPTVFPGFRASHPVLAPDQSGRAASRRHPRVVSTQIRILSRAFLLARIVVSTEQRCDAIPERGFPFSRALLLYSHPRLSRANSASTVDKKKGKEEGRGERRDANKKKEFSRLVSFLHALYFFFLFQKFLLEKTREEKRGSVVSLLSTGGKRWPRESVLSFEIARSRK